MKTFVQLAGDSLLNGISLLLFMTPASMQRSQSADENRPDFTRHFAGVGGYLHQAALKELSSDAVTLSDAEMRQLELELHS